MATIDVTEVGEHRCPYAAFAPCLGPRCMAWSWADRAWDDCETDNLTDTEDGPRPVGDPKSPDGEGWEAFGASFAKGYHQSTKLKLPQAKAQRWRRKRALQHGFCGRVGRDGYENF